MDGLRLAFKTRGRSAGSGAEIKRAHIWHAIGTDTWELSGYQTDRQSVGVNGELIASVKRELRV